MKALTKIFFVILIASGFSTSYGNDFKNTIEKANSVYNEGLYDSAIVLYNEVVLAKMESPELYYNLGSAYFKNQNLPKAILYFEKAKKLSPNDEDIIYNLNIANSMIVDKIERVPEMFYKHWWNYFYNLFDADMWTILSLCIWALFIVVLGFFILGKIRRTKKLAFYLAALFLFASVASFGLASQKYYYTKENKEAIIFTPTITVKSSPTLNSVDLFVIHEGTKVKIVDKVDQWFKIKIKDGSIGWLPADAMEMI
jgi:tetratricopeptide (TPR) repeat protein